MNKAMLMNEELQHMLCEWLGTHHPNLSLVEVPDALSFLTDAPDFQTLMSASDLPLNTLQEIIDEVLDSYIVDASVAVAQVHHLDNEQERALRMELAKRVGVEPWEG